MKKHVLMLAVVMSFLAACNLATPENYFDQAVLNTNVITGIANDGSMRELESPSAKLKAGTKDQTEIMKRKEVIENKIQYVEQSFEKVKALKETADTKEMLDASKALYEYVIPIYKNEYTQLANQYDAGATPEQIQAAEQQIAAKYSDGYKQRVDKLFAIGKVFADKNNIKVQWGRPY